MKLIRLITVALLGVVLVAGASFAGTTDIVSVSSTGVFGNNHSTLPSISANGNIVAFMSTAYNLVPGDSNGIADIFVHDYNTGITEIVSDRGVGTPSGGLGNESPDISDDGRYVVFESYDRLVPEDDSGYADVFLHDRLTGLKTVISRSGNGASHYGKISGDGNYVIFSSLAHNFGPVDTNGSRDVYLYDIQNDTYELLSVDNAGVQSNGSSYNSSINYDGTIITYMSQASNLVPNDTNASNDIFVRDRVSGTTVRVDVGDNGKQSGNSHYPDVSADGRYVTFQAMGKITRYKSSTYNVYVRDLQEWTIEAVSLGDNSKFGTLQSTNPKISSDGRYISFFSAESLMPSDINNSGDTYVRDMLNDTLELISVDSAGVQGNGHYYCAISADGSKVAFESYFSLVPGDLSNNDIYLRTR
jgi:hypothetical protein